MKISKTLWAKFFQENKERLPKKYRERYQNLSEDEKQKLGEDRRNILKWEKTLCYNYKTEF